ncbi:MAG: phosphate/phosphite/phosphonate ABC transporter substrate-binding protein [Gammaproteobacteria bacterium]|nr:phosphate/phosphite/phosphonate ABC transporter substrate-binding protein [Gammaproteobacteria bacterium]MDH5653471.1 phosphate/phosphite/phosphonate ABC transporter substrate-binding protein [Gammaproteobacteria bacterium]
MAIFLRIKLLRLVIVLVSVALIQCLPLSAGANESIQLAFGLYASDKPTTLVQKFRPILNKLEKDLSGELHKEVKIKLSISKTYEEGIEQLISGKVDFARFGPASYVMARNRNPDIHLLAMETRDGSKLFQGVIITHRDSTIHKLSDLKQKRFAFGSRESTIGRYLSQQYLLEHGIKAKDLAHYDYLGRHDSVGYAVALKKFDAGALKESTVKKLLKKGQPLRVIARFNNVTKPWVARNGLDKQITQALKQALYKFDDKQLLANIKKDGFVPATHQDYLIIEKAIQGNSAFFAK